MWEVWKWDGHYIKGEMLKRCKKKETAIKYAKENIKYHKTDPVTETEIFLEDKNGIPIGMIFHKTKPKK